MEFPYAEIEKKLGYVFRDKALLKQAFTHSTYANAHGGKDNERMEYLGDSVLQLVVTEWQYEKDNRTEGKLSDARQELVCREALDSAVDGLGVYDYLLSVGTKQNLGEKTKSNLFEAVTAAVYLDGGYEAAKTFIYAHGNLTLHGEHSQNYKGALQEFLQGRGEQPPRYELKKTGKDHAPMFECTAFALGEQAEGQGKNKREAESVAASRLLWELKQKYGEKGSPQKKRKK